MASPWQGSGVDFGFFQERVDTTACHRDPVAFLSCIGSVQALMDASGRELRVAPLAALDPHASIVRRFGELAVVRDPGPRMVEPGNALDVVRVRRLRIAGALQDHGRSLLIGERTFGKGAVQTARAWSYRPTVLEFFTAARYYRPSGRALREEDLFPTALPEDPAASPPPAPPAAGLEEAIGCVRESGLAGHRFARERAQGRTSDYHLLVAQDLLVCGLGRAR